LLHEDRNTDKNLDVEEQVSISLRLVQQSIQTDNDVIILCVLVHNTATAGLYKTYKQQVQLLPKKQLVLRGHSFPQQIFPPNSVAHHVANFQIFKQTNTDTKP